MRLADETLSRTQLQADGASTTEITFQYAQATTATSSASSEYIRTS